MNKPVKPQSDDHVVKEAKAELVRIRQHTLGNTRMPDDVSWPVAIIIRALQIVFIVFCLYTLISLISNA